MLSHQEVRAFYDRFGAKQDWQSIYEDRAVADLVEHLSLGSARSVFELGCGTGRLAEQLLRTRLPSDANYLGIDISSTMIRLAGKRTLRFGSRAEVRLTSGETRIGVPPDSFDRFLSAYVLELLSEDEIQLLLHEAHRMLVPGGSLGLVTFTHGFTFLSRIVERIWAAAYRLRPSLVGGCRPLHLKKFVKDGWRITYLREIARFGVASEVLVAKKV